MAVRSRGNEGIRSRGKETWTRVVALREDNSAEEVGRKRTGATGYAET